MPCLLAIVVLAFPRVVLVLMWLLSNSLDRAYHGLLIPILGFIFLPITTIVYAWMVNSGLPIQGVNLVIIVVAVFWTLDRTAAALGITGVSGALKRVTALLAADSAFAGADEPDQMHRVFVGDLGFDSHQRFFELEA